MPPVELEQDRQAFVHEDDFGEPLDFTPPGGGPAVTVTGIVDRTQALADGLDNVSVRLRAYSMRCTEADLGDVTRDWETTIDGVGLVVADTQADGTGMVDIAFRRPQVQP